MATLQKKTAPNATYSIESLFAAFKTGASVLFRGKVAQIITLERVDDINLVNRKTSSIFEVVFLIPVENTRSIRLRARLISSELVLDYGNTQAFHDAFNT